MSKFFINRPIVAMVISIVMVIVGAVTISALPVALFPNIVPPEVQVVATYVGADAQTIEQSVATPIEQQMSGVDNMNYMYSLNSTADGGMRLIVDFDVKTDPGLRWGDRGNSGGFDCDEAGILFVLAAHSGKVQTYSPEGKLGAVISLDGGPLPAVPGRSEGAITELRIYKDDLVIRRRHPTELFRTYDRITGKHKHLAVAQHDVYYGATAVVDGLVADGRDAGSQECPAGRGVLVQPAVRQ